MKENNLAYEKSGEFLSNKTIVFDLDETLVHSQVLSSKNKVIKKNEAEALILQIQTGEDSVKTAKVFIRPGMFKMLTELKEAGFELILFTAGNVHYMKSIVEQVFTTDRIPQGTKVFSHMLSRDEMRVLADLTTHTGELVKDLQCLLEDRNLKNIVLVDNSEQKAQLQPKNLVPCFDFKGEGDDDYCHSLTEYLKEFLKVSDVRNKIIKDFHEF